MIDIQIQITGYKGLMKGLGRAPMFIEKGIYNALNKSLYNIERESKLRTPVKTGRLRASIGKQSSGGWRWIRGNVASMGTNVYYASYVEEGTKPHLILPRRKKALYWDGAPHPFKSVMHPGFKGRKFMERGVDASLSAIEKHFDEAIGKVAIEIVNQSD